MKVLSDSIHVHIDTDDEAPVVVLRDSVKPGCRDLSIRIKVGDDLLVFSGELADMLTWLTKLTNSIAEEVNADAATAIEEARKGLHVVATA